MSTTGPVWECVALIITFARAHAASPIDRGARVFDEVPRRGDQVERDECRGCTACSIDDGLGEEIVVDSRAPRSE